MKNEVTAVVEIEQQEHLMNNQQAIEAAKAMGIEQLDAQLLLLFALGRSSHERAWLLAHDSNQMLKDEQSQYMALLQRRAIGVPVAYLVGEKEFYGLQFSVDRRVLVPRPDTETLIDWALEILPAADAEQTPPLKVLDLGTGSGILAITLKHLRPQLEVTAVDASSEALGVAKLNSADILSSDSAVEFLEGSWFEPVAGKHFNLIVSNPPYIAEDDEHLAVLEHEPYEALVSGIDGLDDIRHIVNQATAHLTPNGWLMLEHGYDQASAVQELLIKAGFSEIYTQQDLAGNNRITGGCWL